MIWKSVLYARWVGEEELLFLNVHYLSPKVVIYTDFIKKNVNIGYNIKNYN